MNLLAVKVDKQLSLTEWNGVISACKRIIGEERHDTLWANYTIGAVSSASYQIVYEALRELCHVK